MNKQLEQQLQDDFPFMRQNKVDCEQNRYRRWGCECSDGWYYLIHDMCQAITDRYVEEGLSVDLIPQLLKEKFATLRFYYSFESCKHGNTESDMQHDKHIENLWHDIAQIIYTYEDKSGTVCEKCGNTDSAVIRKDLRWQKTLCDVCYEKISEARKLRENEINQKMIYIDC